MRIISVFNHVSVDGYFAGPKGEIDWFKVIEKDDEYDTYTHGQSKSGNALLFGRTTYEMMKSYWPTPDAIRNDPGMAGVMNDSPKIVFSKRLGSVEEGPNWKNLKLLREVERDEILALKERSDITILGSGSIVQQIANLGLIDEYTLVVVPVVLGEGRSLFDSVRKTSLKLHDSRSFRNGIVVLRYAPRE